ncbi:MAG: hypothetical protein K2X78_08150, partial [Burkholderiaceae bacterium]|nr:hypothetical protein [Burkholderiaceae bacterium]
PGVFALDSTAYSTVALSGSAPAALGAVASPGVSDAAARSDHVHAFPSAAQVGAEPAITKSLGALVWNGSTWVFDNTAYIPASAVGSAVQAYDADLAAIAALAGNSGLLRKTGANTWSLDTTAYQTQQSVNGLVKSSGTTRSAAVAGTDYVAPGGALGTPSSGNVSGCTMDGNNPVGSRNIPMVSQSANYTCVLTDAGRALRHPSADTAARVFTIPSNAAVPYIEGTAITFLNLNGAGPITIAINSDVMRLAGPGTTGSRTLSANGQATAVKVGPTEWQISGVNLT